MEPVPDYGRGAGSVCVCVCWYVYACVCDCVHCLCVCKQLSSNQSFDRQIYIHKKGGGVSTWGEWLGKATAYKCDICTLIGVYLTMHLVDPIEVHVSYTYVCVGICKCVYMCMRTCVCVFVSEFHLNGDSPPGQSTV